jgi:uridine kinase
MKRAHFIGIAGGSCSGKTTLARELARRLGGARVACIAIDSYYRGLPDGKPETVEKHNFDDPGALEHELLVAHLAALSDRRTVEVPVYDFVTHTRTAKTERVDPVPFVIVEGLFPLYWEAVRAMMDTKVFVDAAHDVCLSRRLRRDATERGRPREEVERRYNEMARPMYERYVLPSRWHADVVVDGERPVEEAAGPVVRHIEASGGFGG